jgi:hypothetical protein
MKPNPYAGKELWAFDTETHLIQPGLLAPPLVCGSWARDLKERFGEPTEGILNKRSAIKDFRSILEGDMVLVGHNLAYDIGVMCAADPTLIPLVFDKYERGEVFDTMIAQQLIEIHAGLLDSSRDEGSAGGKSLDQLGQMYCGVDRSDEKHGPDAWRLRYAELDGVPLSEWPEAAIAYPIRDARFTYDVAAAQIKDGRNLHDLPAQCRAHLALHFTAMWGVRTDPEWVGPFVEKVTAEHERSRAYFLAEGLLKVKKCGKKADGTPEEPDDIDLDALEEAIDIADGRLQIANTVQDPKRVGIATKLIKELEKAVRDLKAGAPCRYAGDRKSLEELVTEAYEGEPPRGAPTPIMKKKAAELGMQAIGNIKTNKDALKESGDELLLKYAEAQDNEKFFSTYLKVLKLGTSAPIGARYNVLVDTGRTSCSKPNMQNLPRGSKTAGNPREGFVSRQGYAWSSNDYPTLELRTLAFALEYYGLESEMAKALRQGIDLHAKLAAQILGVSLEEFMVMLESDDEAIKQKAKDFRQMSKAANFGLPGGLGASKFVIYARDSYQARLCLLSGRATKCGVEKHFDKRSKVVVCKACHQVATELKDLWFATWPEMKVYFQGIKEMTGRSAEMVENDDGELVEMNMGEVTQIITERVRGRCTFTNGANTVFQGLAADVAKRALWLTVKECLTLPESPLWGSRPVVFVHDEIITEHPVAKASAGAQRVAELMDQAFAEFCGPDPLGGLTGIPCKVEPALMFRWHKGAETERDDADNVIPVEACPVCKKLAPLEWSGCVRPHNIKGQPCDGSGKVHPVAVARGLVNGLPIC